MALGTAGLEFPVEPGNNGRKEAVVKRYYYHTPDGELHGSVDVDFLIREIRYAGLPLGLMVREEHSEDWIWVGDAFGTPPEWQSFKEQDAGTEEWMKPGKVWRCGMKPHFNWLFSLLAMRGRSSRWEAVEIGRAHV